jgi:glycosyltransferase involved in cell wall biosynthesis
LDDALRVAETAEQFAQSIGDLLARPDEAQAAGAAARRYVEANHRWSRAADMLFRVYDAASRRVTDTSSPEPFARNQR